MKFLHTLGLLAAITLTAQAQQTLTVSVNNPMKKQRTDVPVVINLEEYGDVRSALVTSDGVEQIIIRGAGCTLMSSRDFFEDCQRKNNDLKNMKLPDSVRIT